MSNNTPSNTIQKTITIKDMFNTALRHWHILVPIVLICFIASTVYSAFIVTPMYSSSAKLYIINKASDSSQLTSTDFNISTYLTKDFAEILSDEVVLSEIAEDMNGKYSIGHLKNFLDIEATENTRLIEINVVSPNAKDSKKIADSICRISQEKLPEIMGLDRVKVVRNGSVAKKPSSPNVATDAIKGLIAGIAIAMATVFVIHITNNKITSADDVEKVLGVSVLTVIPFNQGKLKKK